jgi:hypothetical protein
MDRLFILAIAIMIAGALSGGFYSVAGTPGGGAMIINRLTGSVWDCTAIGCDPIPYRKNSN